MGARSQRQEILESWVFKRHVSVVGLLELKKHGQIGTIFLKTITALTKAVKLLSLDPLVWADRHRAVGSVVKTTERCLELLRAHSSLLSLVIVN